MIENWLLEIGKTRHTHRFLGQSTTSREVARAERQDRKLLGFILV